MEDHLACLGDVGSQGFETWHQLYSRMPPRIGPADMLIDLVRLVLRRKVRAEVPLLTGERRMLLISFGKR